MNRSLLQGFTGLFGLILLTGMACGGGRTTHNAPTPATNRGGPGPGVNSQPRPRGTGAPQLRGRHTFRSGAIGKWKVRGWRHGRRHYIRRADGVVVLDPGPGGVDDPATPTEYGLKIDDMRDNGAAAQAGLQLGDIIVSVGGVRVQSAADLQAALQGMDGPTEVVFIGGDSGETQAVDAPVQDGRLGVVEVEVVALDVDNG